MHSTAPPKFTDADAAEIALRHFGMKAQAKLLVAERDQNFKLIDNKGVRFVLKIANAAEDPAVTEFQALLLTCIEKSAPSLPVSRIIRTAEGDVSGLVAGPQGEVHRVRLLSWLDGKPLREVNVSPALATELGRLLGHLDIALEAFQHPASDHNFHWDMKRVSGLRSRVRYIKPSPVRREVLRLLDRFEQNIEPRLGTMRQQVIYNDLNPSNVLVDPLAVETVRGLIDFGDAVFSPLVIDLAVACAYQLEDAEDPFRLVWPLIQGYQLVNPLYSEELELVYDLIRTRHLMTLIITHWRAALHPENRIYITRNSAHAAAVLQRLQRVEDEQIINRFFQFGLAAESRDEAGVA
jgi:Ser/Thr protein kinase RdoA (MazF antagonist)